MGKAQMVSPRRDGSGRESTQTYARAPVPGTTTCKAPAISHARVRIMGSIPSIGHLPNPARSRHVRRTPRISCEALKFTRLRPLHPLVRPARTLDSAGLQDRILDQGIRLETPTNDH